MSIFKKADKTINTAVIKLMAATSEPAAPIKEQSKTCRRAKKILLTAITAAMVMTICTMTVFAEGEGLPSFFTDGINVLKTVVFLIGAGLAVWGIINLMEGYGNDNPGAKSQGMKQLMAGIGVALVGILLIPKLKDLMTDTTTEVTPPTE